MGQVLQMNDAARRPTPAKEKLARVPAPNVRARLLELVPGTITELGAAMGRPSSDKTLRRRLAELEADGVLVREDGLYSRAPEPARPELPAVELPDGFEDYVFPTYFDHEAKVVFVVKLDEFEFIDWTSTAIELLESYVGCLQRARTANDAIAGDAAFKTSDAGRVYVHPGVAVATKAERDAQVYRKALYELDAIGGGGTAEEPPSLF
jgi:hypothetical protein